MNQEEALRVLHTAPCKVITLYEPWAMLAAIEAKKNETRGWATSFRGRLGIHAGSETKYIDMRSKHYICDKEPFYSVLMREAKKHPGLAIIDFMPRAAIVAICILTDCKKIGPHPEFPGLLNISEQEEAFGDYTPGRFMWVLENMERVDPPIPAKGKQGLWEWKG